MHGIVVGSAWYHGGQCMVSWYRVGPCMVSWWALHGIVVSWWAVHGIAVLWWAVHGIVVGTAWYRMSMIEAVSTATYRPYPKSGNIRKH